MDGDQTWPTPESVFLSEMSKDEEFDVEVGDTKLKFKCTLYRREK